MAGTSTKITFRRQVIGSNVVDVQLIPFMRSKKVFFRAQGLRPRTRYFPYFGKKNIDNFTRPESTFTLYGNRSDDQSNVLTGLTAHPDGAANLVSDSAGQLIGSFVVPNNSAQKFRTGQQEFKLMDISGGNDENAISTARTGYTASGIIQTIQETIRSTRVVTRTVAVSPPVQNDNAGEKDPLAQSFLVDHLENPNGIFVTKVRVYFRSKDAAIPVQCQIRPMIAGVPDQFHLPGAFKFLAPSEVTVTTSTDIATIRSNGTDFEFEEPIFLTPGRNYAIVLLAESVDYLVHVARTYDFVIGSTEARVAKQPTLGSLFLSQNSSTWTPDQDRDMMFQIYRADFKTSGTALFANATDIREKLPLNSMLTTAASKECRVFMEGHGLSKNDKVFVSGVVNADVTSAFADSSDAAKILGSRTVTKVDHTGFTFNADSNAANSLFVGGENMVVTRNIMYEDFHPYVQTLLPSQGTTAAASVKLVSGGSFAGTGDAARNVSPSYSKDASFSNIVLNDTNLLASPAVILNDSNVGVHSVSGASFDLKIDLATDDTKVSPVIDLQRTTVLGYENIIDKQDASVTDGFNIPISIVDETDKSDGTHAAKHVTIPVVLEEAAVGLKILMTANRPAAAGFRVFFKTGTADDNLDDLPFVEIAENTNNPADEQPNVFREYEFLPGGQVGNLSEFTQFQVKIVMTSTNSAQVPTIRDLRVIALVT